MVFCIEKRFYFCIEKRFYFMVFLYSWMICKKFFMSFICWEMFVSDLFVKWYINWWIYCIFVLFFGCYFMFYCSYLIWCLDMLCCFCWFLDCIYFVNMNFKLYLSFFNCCCCNLCYCSCNLKVIVFGGIFWSVVYV